MNFLNLVRDELTFHNTAWLVFNNLLWFYLIRVFISDFRYKLLSCKMIMCDGVTANLATVLQEKKEK